ncbi:cytochrome c oxidase assembly protein [Pseudoalteromonas sp. MMG012]|uniref:cytochrome c oxidase assembly protein n=1 Tax=Pseudoalteromonas sp. MMG012 TaxID=2822686 RepID=UPI001B3A4036|nr:cytochrome c oxidase assembly protein [Pseudoalteromonas sp. MMG012]MBQ4850453.1 cytochrome c oxidase assembly protein [Pseudoalteromonas sp. MMG012]
MEHSVLLKKLLLSAVAMFAFAFALVPLYDVFCDVTGLNGKPNMEVAAQSQQIVNSRTVDVSFTTHAQQSAPFAVKAQQYMVQVKPGEMTEVIFSAQNLSKSARVMQAVPSVSPGRAAKYLHKMACFCFDKQAFAASEQLEFKLLFYVDTELPLDVKELTLSYTVFDISDSAQANIHTVTASAVAS